MKWTAFSLLLLVAFLAPWWLRRSESQPADLPLPPAWALVRWQRVTTPKSEPPSVAVDVVKSFFREPGALADCLAWAEGMLKTTPARDRHVHPRAVPVLLRLACRRVAP